MEHGRLGGVFVWTRPFHRIAVAAPGGGLKGLSATAVDPHRTKAWENGIWILRRDQPVLIMDPRSERNENVSVREE